MSSTLSPAWLRELRADAARRFDSMVWPTREEEAWRRTDLARFDLTPFRADRESGEGQAFPRAVESSTRAGFQRFETGNCAELVLSSKWRDRGVRFETIGALTQSDNLVSGLLREALETAEDKVAVWHFAELAYGAFLYVPPGLMVDEPFFIDIAEGGLGRLASPQLVIILGEGAQATAVTHFRERAGSKVLCNSREDLSLGQASRLKLYASHALGSEALLFHSSRACLSADSSLDRLEVQLGGRMARSRIDCALQGRGADARLDGLYYCGSGQEADIGPSLRHLSPGASSRAQYKGAIQGGGRAAFQGLIEVGEGASGTDAYLANRNLLLGESARADSIPTLKIGNNDVRCSHGSATGRLGKEELFYLQSRGLSESEAREILVLGFFEELLDLAPESFREEALAELRLRLPEAA